MSIDSSKFIIAENLISKRMKDSDFSDATNNSLKIKVKKQLQYALGPKYIFAIFILNYNIYQIQTYLAKSTVSGVQMYVSLYFTTGCRSRINYFN